MRSQAQAKHCSLCYFNFLFQNFKRAFSCKMKANTANLISLKKEKTGLLLLDFFPHPPSLFQLHEISQSLIKYTGLLGRLFRRLMVQYFNIFCKILLTIIFIIFIILYFFIA